jgi:hypothetical protein
VTENMPSPPAGSYPNDRWPGGQRYWDGAQWTDHVPEPPSDRRRRDLLTNAVGQAVAAGSRVESQTDFQAVVVHGTPTNHVLHLILTLVSCFIWAPFWLLIRLLNKEKRTVVSVDEYRRLRYRS